MRAGELRHRGTLQRKSDSSTWGTSGTWTTYATVWVKIEPTSGREYPEGRKIQAETTHLITMRFIHGVHPDMRFLFEGRIFKIVSAINVQERSRELMLECTEAVV